MIEKLKWIWMDGKLVPWDEANVHILSHTLHYGVGAFEGIRAYRHEDGRSAVFRLREHDQRLIESAHLLELKVPYTREQIDEAALLTLAANGMDCGYIRPLIYLGEREVGVYPGNTPDVRVAVIAWKWGAYLGPEALEKGIRVKVSTWTKHHPNALLVRGKVCGHYVNSVLAKVEAKREGYDEGILLDHCGYVAEGSGENLFVVRNGELFTPDLSSSVLGGITRDTVLYLAADMGLKVHQCRLTRSDLYLADEVFFSGTAAEITPIYEIDRRQVGEGKAGPITRQIQQTYMKLVAGGVPGHDAWFSFYKPEPR
ncbi:MAG TPA: branched-chain amino acid transaminase [Myxococcota bacterium]|nr:branched-chain amino acid transaminase [Myxococcota bacterium]HQP96045.1 branched-chain amino acid transaminase [Myxococcota bacterium]